MSTPEIEAQLASVASLIDEIPDTIRSLQDLQLLGRSVLTAYHALGPVRNAVAEAEVRLAKLNDEAEIVRTVIRELETEAQEKRDLKTRLDKEAYDADLAKREVERDGMLAAERVKRGFAELEEQLRLQHNHLKSQLEDEVAALRAQRTEAESQFTSFLESLTRRP